MLRTDVGSAGLPAPFVALTETADGGIELALLLGSASLALALTDEALDPVLTQPTASPYERTLTP